ncbi:MAG: oxidoreductase [Ottowia sp.]|nr:oxidoreductase [Ottowia sp.]
MKFSAIYLDNKEGQFHAALCQLDDFAWPQENVWLSMAYASLNYKDGLAITHRGPIVRSWPMVAGIDGVGTVLASDHPDWQVGEQVIYHGWGASETRWGCLAERAYVRAEGLVRLPLTMHMRDAAAMGTAGLTAMLCVLALERNHILPNSGDILVTGASGGVGSIAVALLAKLGYKVIASTGKEREADFLRQLGAHDIIHRSVLGTPNAKPLQSARWAGVVDVVGSHTLANALAQTCYGGVVTACGLVQGMDLPTTVAPFILRNVQLVGIDSAWTPHALRTQAWQRLASDLLLDKLHLLTQEIDLSTVIPTATQLMAGKIRGRVVVKIDG